VVLHDRNEFVNLVAIHSSRAVLNQGFRYRATFHSYYS